MGDRTYVNLQVLNTQAEKAREIFFDTHHDDESANDETTNFGFSEVNYGNLYFLDKLRDAGIAFDSNWDAGYEYGAGTASCRFTPEGDCVRKDIYDHEINPDMYKLMELIDKPVELRAYILAHKEEKDTLDWDDQEEYGKRYLAKKLITGSQ